MRHFQRSEEPLFLAQKAVAWGREWEERKAANSAAQFHWHVVSGEKVNVKLLIILKEQTQAHCSFCDFFPVSPPSIDTVEHFRPKATYPREAYSWENLYFCCFHCQRKGAGFSDSVLRPDAPAYTFDRYFRWDYTLGKVEVNEKASIEDQECARVTILYFRLNEGHPIHRKAAARLRSKALEEPLDTFPYRDFVG